MNNCTDRFDWRSAFVCAAAVSFLAGWVFVLFRLLTGLAGLVDGARFLNGINL